MKNYLIILLPLALSACVQPTWHPTANMPTKDMKTVEEYHKQVMSGKTINGAAPPNDILLNGSDYKPKTPSAATPANAPNIWQKELPEQVRKIYSEGSTQRHTTSHKTTEVLKDTPNEKQTRTVEKSETKWKSKGFSFGL
ncbi:hypothetical protein ACWA5Z_07925 [Testudinibacter sp. P80/BLE/0925]|uniref:hypothetical protein n=1 Tax=Testudinibacter sp. TW-1 TaxID=3417757 RepID=UPI003D368631